jgi:hypothetical protein
MLVRWIGLQCLAAIPLLGWIVVLATRQGQYFGIGWIPAPRPIDLLLTMMNFTFGSTRPQPAWQWAALAGCAVLAVLGLRSRWASDGGKTMAIMWAGVPILTTFLASLKRPVYMDRFLIGVLPVLLLLIAAGLASLRGWRTAAAATLLAGLFAWSSLGFAYWPGQPKEQWREAGAYLERARPGEIIVPRIAQILVPMSYYYSGSVPITPMEVNRQRTPLGRLTAGKSGVWLVYWSPAIDAHRVAQGLPFDPRSEDDSEALAWLTGQGPRLVEQKDFTGITILHFAFPAAASPAPQAAGNG